MYVGRKLKKRQMRRLWIVRMNAAARLHGMSYSRLIHALHEGGIELDRKVLAELAIVDPAAFGRVVEQAKSAVATAA
jgi:large subunit ribosomal protein L20